MARQGSIRFVLGVGLLAIVGVVGSVALVSAGATGDATGDPTGPTTILEDGRVAVVPPQAPEEPRPSEGQVEQARREAPLALARLIDDAAGEPMVGPGIPWTDGFGNLVGVAVDVTYGRPVVLAPGAPLPERSTQGCESHCEGRFTPTPEEPYRVVASDRAMESSSFVLFYDVRTTSLAFVRIGMPTPEVGE